MAAALTMAALHGTHGVLTPGMGAVSTTLMGGVELIRTGRARAIGPLTQLGTIRLGKRTDACPPPMRALVPLEQVDRLLFGGWDVLPHSAYDAACEARLPGPPHDATRHAALRG